MDKDPNRRYQSARELRIDLERLSSGVVPVYSSPRRTWLWAAALIVVGIAVVAAVIFGGFRNRNASQPAVPASVKPGSGRRSVAVVRFKNSAGKADQAWMSTALAEMLTTELAAGEQLRTVPGEDP